MSGSRGEANFVFRCKNCKVRMETPGRRRRMALLVVGVVAHKMYLQRESSATIKEAPKAYEQVEPAKPKNILEFDCRGLEFTEFKPEVCIQFMTITLRWD